MPYCPHCGNEIPPLATICATCGRPIAGIAEVAISYGEPDLRPAGFWIRLAGFLIDGLILAVVHAVVSRILDLPGAILTGPNFDPNDPRYAFGWTLDRGAFAVRQLVGYAVAVVYSSAMIAFNHGRTVGAMAVGVRVARTDDGGRVGIAQASLRQAFAVVSRVPLYLGFLWAAWDRDGKTWHDRIAGTRVYLTR